MYNSNSLANKLIMGLLDENIKYIVFNCTRGRKERIFLCYSRFRLTLKISSGTLSLRLRRHQCQANHPKLNLTRIVKFGQRVEHCQIEYNQNLKKSPLRFRVGQATNYFLLHIFWQDFSCDVIFKILKLEPTKSAGYIRRKHF